MSCPDRNLAVFHHYRHYEGLRLLPSVCDSKLIQQTLIGSEIDRTKRTYSFSLSYYANTTDADDEAVEKSIAKLEKMDKIAKITLVPWSKYEKISKDLNKDEAI